MAACEPQKPECSKDNISTNSIDEGLPRELSQLSLSSATSQDELFSDKGHSDSTLKNIFGYFQAQKLCDVALIAGGCRLVCLHANYFILAVYYNYYKFLNIQTADKLLDL